MTLVHDDETNIRVAPAAPRSNPRLRLVVGLYKRLPHRRPVPRNQQLATAGAVRAAVTCARRALG
jgi:hypothetical protein